MKRFLLLQCILLQALYSQFIPSKFSEEFEEDVKKRNKWFFEERLAPSGIYNNGIDVIGNALTQKKVLKQSGYSDNSASWVSLGPAPADWASGVFTASRIRQVVYDPDEPNIVYIGSSGGGLWKSVDGGLNWQQKTDNEVSLSSGALAVYNNWSTNPPQRIVYLGTGEGGFGFVYSYYGRGLLKSTDGGNSWRQITSGLPLTTYFFKIAINPQAPNVLLAALGTNYTNPVNTGGIYRSEDFGETWTRIVPSTTAEDGLTCSDVVFSPDGTRVYALGPNTTGSPNWWENGIGYRISVDGGRTFSQPLPSLAGPGYFSIFQPTPHIIYAFTPVDCNFSNFYRSVDAGNSWVLMSSSFTSNQCGYNMTLEAHPQISTTVYAGTLSLVRSTSSGVFFDQGIPVFHPDIHDITFNPQNPNEYIVACDGGVLKTTNSGNLFTNLNFTLSTMECYSITSDPSEPFRMFIGTQDNGLFLRGSAAPPANAWKAISGYDVTNAVVDPLNQNRIIAQFSGSPVGIHVSTNAGLEWVEARGLPPDGDYAWIRPIVADPLNPVAFYTPYRNRIFLSNDFGANWTGIGNTGIDEKIQELTISRSNPNIMYAGTGPFEFMPNATVHRIYKSTDKGLTWTDINFIPNVWVPFSLPNRYVSSIKIDRDNHDDILITFAGFGTKHVWRTTDGGQRWNSLDCSEGNSCLPDVPVNDLDIYYNPVSGQREYFIATDMGVYRSTGDGAWLEMTGLPNTIAMDMEAFGSKIRVATFGRGVFEWDLASGSPTAPQKKNITAKANLYPNYPNPFNPETKIKYTVPKAGKVKISVYDILGREVALLVNGIVEAGTFEATFNANGLSSGVYFYKLTAGDYTEVRKMVLAK